ncbi:Uncharacterized protein Adt_41836 [Abeliophyllum distichum]|uniref:Uncharacterized protein n=1 Tax=Abeliophyllum distichum TaxID=126358 RepID=A0ABD1PQ26_9LAMI
MSCMSVSLSHLRSDCTESERQSAEVVYGQEKCWCRTVVRCARRRLSSLGVLVLHSQSAPLSSVVRSVGSRRKSFIWSLDGGRRQLTQQQVASHTLSKRATVVLEFGLLSFDIKVHSF